MRMAKPSRIAVLPAIIYQNREEEKVKDVRRTGASIADEDRVIFRASGQNLDRPMNLECLARSFSIDVLYWLTSASLPITGSSFPSLARSVRSTP